MKEITTCPICNNSEKKTFIKSRNFRINKVAFDIEECTQCNFRYTSPIPSKEEIGQYYPSDSYVSHNGTKKGIVNKLFHLTRFFTLRSKFKLISNTSNGKKHLDIGAGNGVFLEYVKSKGWDVSGIELDDKSRESIEKRLGIKVAKTVHDNQETEKYDVITMWHVLEHIYDLKKDIETIKQKLKNDGVLIIAVPNCESYDAKKYKKYWAAYDLPIHLYHFRPKNIRELFSQFNMEVKEIKPMKFDSYYISLVSEKYKNNGKSSIGILLKGFYNGLISNLKAKNDTYSSQIYIIKKK